MPAVDQNEVVEVYEKMWELILGKQQISRAVGIRKSNMVKVTDGKLIPNIGHRTAADLHRMSMFVSDSTDNGEETTTSEPTTFCEEQSEGPDVLEQQYRIELIHPNADANINLQIETVIRRAIRGRALYRAGLSYVTNATIETTREIPDTGELKGREVVTMVVRVFMEFQE
jgi:hypothetical protein